MLNDWDTGKELNMALSDEQLRLLNLLRLHRGKANAISLVNLYEYWSATRIPHNFLGKPIADVPTLTRRMRCFIDDLIQLHGVPILSSTKSGYWIIGSEEELLECVRQLRRGAFNKLKKSSCLTHNSIAEESEQMHLDIQSGESS